MSKFNIGDIVRRVKTEHPTGPIGEILKIHLCRPGNYVVYPNGGDATFAYTVNENEIEPVETVYVATLTNKHYDLYDQDEDGTIIIGVHKTLDGALKCITEAYETDRRDFLEGSCKAGGDYIIDEENSYDPIRYDDRGSASAMITIREKDSDTPDRDYTYEVERREVAE